MIGERLDRIPVVVSYTTASGTTQFCAICKQLMTSGDGGHTYTLGLQFHTVCYERTIREAKSLDEAREAIAKALIRGEKVA